MKRVLAKIVLTAGQFCATAPSLLNAQQLADIVPSNLTFPFLNNFLHLFSRSCFGQRLSVYLSSLLNQVPCVIFRHVVNKQNLLAC